MRNLHTHINGSSQLVDLPPIGRGQDPNPLGPYQAADQQLAEKKAPSTYSIRTKWGQMDENLALAKGFVGKQISNLREINKTIDIWSNESSRGSHCTGQIAHVFLGPIERLANDVFINHYLFDDGTTPPLKIHFSINGTRDFLELPVLPLKSQPGFMSLMSFMRIPSGQSSRNLFQTCSAETLQLLIQADSVMDAVNNKMEITRARRIRNLRPTVNPNILTKSANLIARILGLSPKIPFQLTQNIS
jgi:hypothetical protein